MSSSDIPPDDQELPETVDRSLDAALNWLRSGQLSEEERASITAGIDASAAKLAAYQHVLGASRASRLALNQRWLDRALTTILDPDPSVELNPYYWLQVAQLLRQLQEDDTKYIQSLAKQEDDDLVEARRLTQRSKGEDIAKAAEEIAKIPPHVRERLRKLFDLVEKGS